VTLTHSAIRAIELAFFFAARRVRLLVGLEQLLGFLEGLVVDQPQMLEVADPLLALLRRTTLLADVPVQRVSDVRFFPQAQSPMYFRFFNSLAKYWCRQPFVEAR
jgi:hypothetical protein